MSNKIIPLVVNNQAQFAICIISGVPCNSTCNLFAYQNGTKEIRYKYSLYEKKWMIEPLIHLNQFEFDILMLSKHGLTGAQMADILGIKYQYLRNVQMDMFEFLDVKNTTQALLLAQSHRIVVKTEQNKRKRPKEKKSRKKMTPELLRRVLAMKKEGKSNRSIAKVLDISEFMVRYWCKD